MEIFSIEIHSLFLIVSTQMLENYNGVSLIDRKWNYRIISYYFKLVIQYKLYIFQINSSK